MNTHEGYSKKTISNANVLLAGGGDKSLADFLGGIQYVSASNKIQYKTAADNASWLDLVTLVTTDENVKLVDNNNDENRPILTKNGTGTGTITSSTTFADGVTINPKNNTLSATKFFSSGGFEKIFSVTSPDVRDNYILLAGGGHKAISDFILSTAMPVTSINKTLTLAASTWTDTGILGNALNTGVYIISLYVSDTKAPNYTNYWVTYAGVMTWYSDNTNGTTTEEILLHGSGHAINSRIYLRTIETVSGNGGMKLQIACDKAVSELQYKFKFRRIL